MELLPTTTAHSRSVSYDDANAHHIPPMSGSTLRKSASTFMMPVGDGRTSELGNSEEVKAVMSGVLTKNGQSKRCLLLGAFFMYSDAVRKNGSSASLAAADSSLAKQKQICLSDATAFFRPESWSIHLIRLKSNEGRTPVQRREKVFVARTESEYYLWQAAVTRAMVLWPGANAPDAAGGRPPVNADGSALGNMLRTMLRMWTFITFATNVDVLGPKDVGAGIHSLHTSSARPRPRLQMRAHREEASTGETASEAEQQPETVSLAEHELSTNMRLSKEAFNSILVNTLAQLPHLLPYTLENFIMILLERRGRSTDNDKAKELVEEVGPKLRRVADKFVTVAMEYGFDIATGLWPADIAPTTTTNGDSNGSAPPSPLIGTFDCVELFRAWMSRSPTAPWSAVLVLTQKHLVSGLREVLGVRSPPRSDPLMPGLNGIRNLGNTCYLNSVLQCALHTPHLVRFFLMGSQRLYVGRDVRHDYLSTMLREVYVRMYSNSGTLDASEVANYLIDYDEVAFKKGEQHDAHEFLVTLLDVLDSELCENGCGMASSTGSPLLKRAKRKGHRGRFSGALAPPPEALPDYTSDELSEDELVSHWRAAYVRAHNSFVTHYFSGQTVQKITCPHCMAASFCCDSFTYLIAPIIATSDGANGERRDKYVRLESCLEDTFKPEMMDMGGSAKCAKCKKPLAEAQRTLELQRLPPYLLICLNRFEIDDHGKSCAKRDVPVLVPEQLSLGPWLRRAATLPILGEGGNVHFSQMDRVAKRRGSYELYGAVLHTGTIHKGHYKAACRVGTSWYEYSDSAVNRLASYEVWSEDSAREVYILFYRSTAGDA